MNEFENDPQSNTMDTFDSMMGFIVSFGFFATLFVVVAVIKELA